MIEERLIDFLKVKFPAFSKDGDTIFLVERSTADNVNNDSVEDEFMRYLGDFSTMHNLYYSFVGGLLKPNETLNVWILDSLIIKATTSESGIADSHSLSIEIFKIEGGERLDPAKNILLNAAHEMVAKEIRDNLVNTLVLRKELFDNFELIKINLELEETANDTIQDLEFAILN